MKYKFIQLIAIILITTFTWQSLAWGRTKGEGAPTGVGSDPAPLSPGQKKVTSKSKELGTGNRQLATALRPRPAIERGRAAGERIPLNRRTKHEILEQTTASLRKRQTAKLRLGTKFFQAFKKLKGAGPANISTVRAVFADGQIADGISGGIAALKEAVREYYERNGNRPETGFLLGVLDSDICGLIKYAAEKNGFGVHFINPGGNFRAVISGAGVAVNVDFIIAEADQGDKYKILVDAKDEWIRLQNNAAGQIQQAI